MNATLCTYAGLIAVALLLRAAIMRGWGAAIGDER